MRYALLLAAFFAVIMVHNAYSSYTVTHLNVTVQLNKNSSASVNEVLTISLSNSSVQQYLTNRLALNLTLSTWQTLVGPMLVQHIVNPVYGVYNFKFLPGAVFKNASGNYAYLLMSYNVANVTSINQTGPRSFVYSFNTKVLNFEHGVSGEVLPSNTTFTIVLPPNAEIISIYPIPDVPASAFTTGYRNVTKISWIYGEPLSAFTLKFMVQESINTEVEAFFSGIYRFFGDSIYAIIALLIIAFIVYLYVRAGR
ncbi:MAG: hypothetical protein ACP5TL_01900 [Candidatus Micrarchaeia archaeon]